jgi:hypothetical protein
MDETRFEIIEEPGGIYTVEVKKPGKPLHVVNGFDSREQAEAWIKTHKRSLGEIGR